MIVASDSLPLHYAPSPRILVKSIIFLNSYYIGELDPAEIKLLDRLSRNFVAGSVR